MGGCWDAMAPSVGTRDIPVRSGRAEMRGTGCSLSAGGSCVLTRGLGTGVFGMWVPGPLGTAGAAQPPCLGGSDLGDELGHSSCGGLGQAGGPGAGPS